MKFITGCLAATITLTACSSNTKRILVLIKGSGEINTDTKTITLKDGAGTEEKTADFNQSGTVSLQLKKDDGSTTTLQLPDKGLYVVNAKNDTVIGSYVQYSAPKTAYNTIRQETIKHGIDSLSLLIEGKNVSEANRNFYILPYQTTRITANIDAFIVAPYHQMTSVEKVGDKDPEVYRFYSIKEIRQTIEKLKTLTAPVKADASKEKK